MANFDRTQTSLIQQKASELIEDERVGVITRVYEHNDPNDNSNFEADVQIKGGTTEERIVPLSTSNASSINIPRVGDKVLVGFLAGESKQPVITGVVYTVDDRPPVGKSGMARDEYESGPSPAGDGNLYVTGYTKYNESPNLNNKEDLTAEEALVRIAKRTDTVADPFEEGDVPAQIEFYDSPAKDEAHITVELNKRDGSDSTASWGLKFNLKTGEMKLVDPSGYGIISDGDGNFTWEYESKTENQVSGGGSLSL